MSLNNISLNNHHLTQLYSRTLMETEAKPDNAPKMAKPEMAPPAEPAHAPVAQSYPASAPAPTIAPQSIVAESAPPPFIPATAPAATYGNTPSLGGNKKGILILVSNETAPFLPDAELEFLSAILGACRLSIADVAIVNLQHYPQPYTELIKQFNSRQILLMGITPQQIDLPLHFPHFQLQQFDQRTYLAAPPLKLISPDRDLKMQLWGCLKQLFGV